MGLASSFAELLGRRQRWLRLGQELMLGHDRSVFLTHYYDVTQASSNLPELPPITN